MKMITLQILLPLLGVVVGALLSFFVSSELENRKQAQLLRNQSYADYLKAVSARAHNIPDAKFALTETKVRLSIFGSDEVLHALADFERAGATLDKPGSLAKFMAIVFAMRADSDSTISENDLSVILFGRE